MTLVRLLITILLLTLGLAVPIQAQIWIEGRFQASADCPAVQSIKKLTNPGQASVKSGALYKLLGKNSDNATHYLVEIPGVSPMRRWVPVTCGTYIADGDQLPEPGTTETKNPRSADTSFHILAVSWQPAFCESHPGKPECVSQREESYEATHFTLHGLWPQPRSNVYCGVTEQNKADSRSGNWAALPEIVLSKETQNLLNRVMPGTQSKLERHEWIKHGTCYQPANMEAYFRDSLRLMESLNASAAQTFMAANVGKEISTADLKSKFDETLGAGAGDRMKFSCKKDGNRLLLVEITIGLRGNINSGKSLAELIAAASPTDPGCPRFVVDPTGLQ